MTISRECLETIAFVIGVIVLGSGMLQNSIYFIQLCFAAARFSRVQPVSDARLIWDRYAEDAPPISILVPAYNEQAGIIESVRSLLTMEYPDYEIIVINDGSKDATLSLLTEHYRLVPDARPMRKDLKYKPVRQVYRSQIHPNLYLIDKDNGGKGDSQNAGLSFSEYPLVCVIDADSLLESESLIRVAQLFIEDPERVVAVGGAIRILNGCEVSQGRVTRVALPRNVIALFQHLEYLRAFLMGRVAWNETDTTMIVSGAFGVFRRSLLVEIGGYETRTVGEDLELITKLHRHMIQKKRPYRVAFMPEPVCWTEAPQTLGGLKSQRTRWQRGTLETLVLHRDMIFNPRYGRIGVFGMGQFFISDVLSPAIEVLGYGLMPLLWILGLLSWDFFMAYTALVFAFGVFLSVSALILEEVELRRFSSASDLAILTLGAIVENFGYRQLCNFYRVLGSWHWLSGKSGWGAIPRVGIPTAPSASASSRSTS